jgi:uncharacterized protein
MKKWYVLLLLVCAALFTFSFTACGKRSPAACIEKKDGSVVCVSVETARTQSQRQLGLMYRRQLERDSGMLFFFDREQKQAFTMKNTYIPLDMIFISRDLHIVGWVENATPLTEGPYEVDGASQYVLEVNGLFCREHGITVGNKVLFDALH